MSAETPSRRASFEYINKNPGFEEIYWEEFRNALLVSIFGHQSVRNYREGAGRVDGSSQIDLNIGEAEAEIKKMKRKEGLTDFALHNDYKKVPFGEREFEMCKEVALKSEKWMETKRKLN